MSEGSLSDGVVPDEMLVSTHISSARGNTANNTNDGLAEVGSPLPLLDEARAALLAWQTQMQSRLTETQTLLLASEARLATTESELGETHRVLNNTRAELSTLQTERDAISKQRDGIASERDSIAAERDDIAAQHRDISVQRDQLAQERDALAKERDGLVSEREQIAAERDKLAVERDNLSAERDRWRDDCHKNLAECERLQDHLSDAARRNNNLNTELLELYQDLRAEDLPTLILRIGMKLTDAQNGLYVDGHSQTTIAAIGMDDLPQEITEALHEFTREAANSEEPLVQNESDSLPGGADLVNIAALPVAVQGGLKGVLLVANKRSGPFTEEDTELLLSIGSHAGIALENHRLHCELASSYLSTIAVLADAIEAKDPYTRGHCESVADVAVCVAQKLGWRDGALEDIRYAALLHDVGKIGIPDGILLKPGRLLPEEFQVIQRHASIGCDLVSRVPSLENIAPIILHHHERMDGSGYPDGQSGDEISLASRIIGVVDAFDAMTTPRPYRDPVSHQEALEELQRCIGTQFDAAIVDCIAEVLSERAAPNQALDTSPPETTPNAAS